MNAVRSDEEFERRTTRADLIVEGLGTVGALVGEGIARGMGIYQEEVAAV